jgi:hypothetical protein
VSKCQNGKMTDHFFKTFLKQKIIEKGGLAMLKGGRKR